MGAFVALLILSCNANGGNSTVIPNQGSGNNGGDVSGSTTPPPGTPAAYTGTVATVSWQPDAGGYTEFFTNDSSYIHTGGWSEWTWGSTAQQPMNTYEVQVKKVSGDPTMGFGVTFCVQDENNFYVVYMDVTGWYSIGKVVGGTYTAIQAWANADASGTVLYQGYGYVNDILISYAPSSHKFTVSFNGAATTTFTDSKYSGGEFGYAVGISESESFPTQPVDVKFLQKQP